MRINRAVNPSPIKKTLRGESVIAGSSFLTEITISAVDVTKTRVKVLGYRRQSAVMDYSQAAELDLKDSTTLRFRRGHTSSSSLFDVYVSWEVVEYV